MLLTKLRDNKLRAYNTDFTVTFPTQIFITNIIRPFFSSNGNKNFESYGDAMVTYIERYYWKSLYDDIKKFIAECNQFQRKAPLKKARKPLRPIVVKSDPFHQIGMDLVGPLETNEKGVF